VLEGNGCGGPPWNGGGCERRRCEREREVEGFVALERQSPERL